MDVLAGLGTLNCVYFFLFILGVGYALVAAVLGGLSHVDVPGIDIDIPGVDLHPGEPDIHIELPFGHDVSHDVDHPDVGLSPLSPIIIATFITTFGGTGLIINILIPSLPVLSLMASTISGLGLSILMFLFYTRVLMAAQGSSEVRAGEVVGRMAETSTAIEEGKIGQVVLVARGARTRVMARSADGQPIPRGVKVEIVEESGNVVLVRPKEPPAVE
jgi:membrane protein implicated in regulation of membrane protease activity